MAPLMAVPKGAAWGKISYRFRYEHHPAVHWGGHGVPTTASSLSVGAYPQPGEMCLAALLLALPCVSLCLTPSCCPVPFH